MVRLRSPAPYGGFPERPKGADCKSVVTDFDGSNPSSPTNKKASSIDGAFLLVLGIGGFEQHGGEAVKNDPVNRFLVRGSRIHPLLKKQRNSLVSHTA